MLKTRVRWLLLVIALVTGCATAPDHVPQTNGQFDVVELTIAQAQKALQNGQISCAELTRRHLQRIEAYDQPSGLNAIIHINPNALQRAQQLDEKLAQTGHMQTLHCIPVILKDNFDSADMPTEAGSIAMQGSVPPDDAYMVRKLREADAIILAKSNMGEWAFSPYNTVSSTHGETRNAYDLSRVPAGSSGGTASAIAASFGVIGMGTDTGNSIRGPASHLALVGLRSTLGATSRDGIVPLLLNRDVGGPLMRSVADTAIVFSVLAGYDPADPLTAASRGRVQQDYTQSLRTDGLQGVRLGVLRQLYDTPTADFEILELMDRAIENLRAAGAIVIDPFEIAEFAQLTAATGFCSRFRYDLHNYLQSLGNTAPIRTLDELAERHAYLERNQEAMIWAMSEQRTPQAQTPPCVSVQEDPRRKALLDAVVTAMDDTGVDAIIYPSWSNPPREIGDDDSPHGNNSPAIAPHSGQPAITVPMGFNSAGLPAGLQLLARPFDEHKLLQYAYAYEQHTGHRRPPGEYPALQ